MQLIEFLKIKFSKFICFQSNQLLLKTVASTKWLYLYSKYWLDGTGGCDGCLNWKGVGAEVPNPNKKSDFYKYDPVNVTDNQGLQAKKNARCQSWMVYGGWEIKTEGSYY